MKTLKLVPTIMKNIFRVLTYETRKLFRRSKLAKWILTVLAVAVVAGGGYKIWRYYHPDPNDPNLSLAQAARIGQVAVATSANHHRFMTLSFYQ